MRVRYALACLFAVIALAVPAIPVHADNPSPRPWIGAVEAYQSPREAREVGIGWERVNFWWHDIQPNGPEDWDLSAYAARDAALDRDRADGITVVGLIGNPPEWATTNGSVPNNIDRSIDDPENYWAHFVERLVKTYAGKIDEWIIWNEPDFDTDHPASTWAGSTADYYYLLRSAYQAAKRANPKATVVFAGTTYWADVRQHRPLFLERVLADATRLDPSAAAAGYYFDAVSLHIYSTAEHLYTIPAAYREVLRKYGLTKPLWISETNVVPYDDPDAPLPPGGYRASLAEQADFIIQGFALARAAGVERVQVYKLRDNQIVGGEAFGLVRSNGSTRPALEALKLVSTYLGNGGPASYTKTNGVATVVFGSGDHRVTVFWNDTNQPLTSKIRAMGTQAKLIHRDGTVEALSVPIAAGDNFYRIPLPPASAEVDDLQPGHYIIGGETFILVEDGVGKPIELGPNQVFYPITGHFVANGFLDHFRKNGGLAIFGYPRTAEITEGGKTVQYFQRARMEWRDDLGRVELGLLNDTLWTNRSGSVPAKPADPDALYFPETGFGIRGGFKDFFQERGGVDLFGFPISNEMPGPAGQVIQQFQRMRLEYHPEYAGTPDAIQIGLSGDEYLLRQGRLKP